MSELADYIDNSKQGSRSVQKIADILKGSKSLTQFQGKPELFATQEQRNELNLINQRYPNLISMPFETVTNVRTFAGKPTNIYKVIINQDILNRAIEVTDTDSDFNYKNEFEKDQYNRQTSAKTEQVDKEQEQEEEINDSTYTSKENAEKELMDLALNAKVIIESDLQAVQREPDGEKKEIRRNEFI